MTEEWQEVKVSSGAGVPVRVGARWRGGGAEFRGAGPSREGGGARWRGGGAKFIGVGPSREEAGPSS